MLAPEAGKTRLLRYDAGLLLIWCWLLGVAYIFTLGRVAPIEGLGFGLVVFAISSMVLFAKRHSASRLSTALVSAAIITGVVAYGATQI
jgi:cell shape-determining protein MreD